MQVICDSGKRILDFHAGCPGSWADSTVFKRMGVYKDLQAHFSLWQYPLADSVYAAVTTSCVPANKATWTAAQENREFNHCLAMSGVRNEYCIGILKSRWGSLREMRQQFQNENEMRIFLGWVTSYCVLRNMLACLGDFWEMVLNEELPRGACNG